MVALSGIQTADSKAANLVVHSVDWGVDMLVDMLVGLLELMKVEWKVDLMVAPMETHLAVSKVERMGRLKVGQWVDPTAGLWVE